MLYGGAKDAGKSHQVKVGPMTTITTFWYPRHDNPDPAVRQNPAGPATALPTCEADAPATWTAERLWSDPPTRRPRSGGRRRGRGEAAWQCHCNNQHAFTLQLFPMRPDALACARSKRAARVAGLEALAPVPGRRRTSSRRTPLSFLQTN